jgi:hypothetical protein
LGVTTRGGGNTENIWWLEGELKREKKRMRRLQKALIAASDAAKGN